MACQNFIQRGPVPQSNGLPGLAPVAVFPGPLPACRPAAGCPGRPPWALASPFPGLPVSGAPAGPLPIARVPAPARPATACRPLKRLASAPLTRTTGLPDGLPPGPGRTTGLTGAGNRGRPRRVRPRAQCGVAPGPVSRRVRGRGHAAPWPSAPAPAARLVKTPAAEDLSSGRASREPRGMPAGCRSGGLEGPGKRDRAKRTVPCRAGPSPQTRLPSSAPPATAAVIPGKQPGPTHE